jgi:release factor glutamine methyltransferase
MGPWDVIVSNPPYVADADRPALSPDVVDHEPHLALFSGPDGLGCIREIVRLAPAQLTPGGRLLFEFGFEQADAVRDLIAATPALTRVELVPDLQGIPRIAIARREESWPGSGSANLAR